MRRRAIPQRSNSIRPNQREEVCKSEIKRWSNWNQRIDQQEEIKIELSNTQDMGDN